MRREGDVGTRVFHIVFFDYDSSAYVHFLDCNFRCMGCLRRSSIWDCHLPDEAVSRLSFKGLLSLSELRDVTVEVISSYGARKVVLGGGEPTADRSLVDVIRMFKGLGLEVGVLTNAYAVGDELAEELADPRVSVVASVKSIDPSKHEVYTGFPLRPVLDNIVKMHGLGARLCIETILIPGFNGPREVGRLAEFVAPVDEGVPLIIDSFVPVPGGSVEEADARGAQGG